MEVECAELVMPQLPVVEFLDKKAKRKTGRKKRRLVVGSRNTIGVKTSLKDKEKGDGGSEMPGDGVEGDAERSGRPKRTFSSAMEALMRNVEKISSGKRKLRIRAPAASREDPTDDKKMATNDPQYLSKSQREIRNRLIRNQNHVIPDSSTFLYEAGLRKVATRGVIKLFNSIKEKQNSELGKALFAAAPQKVVDRRKLQQVLRKKLTPSISNRSSAPNVSTRPPTVEKLTNQERENWELLRSELISSADNFKDWDKN